MSHQQPQDEPTGYPESFKHRSFDEEFELDDLPGVELIRTVDILEGPVADLCLCPQSTDPAWLPLFIRAKGLVMETGGVLSHGAIVAREFGLPAVAGLPDVHRRIQNGQRLRIDGGAGTVAIIEVF